MSTLGRFVNVNKSYRSGDGVFDLTWEVPRGQIIGLFGLNGSGKTTTLKLCAGLLHPQSGRVEILGQQPELHRRHVAFLGDRLGFASWMTPTHMGRFMEVFFQDFNKSQFDSSIHQMSIPIKPLRDMSLGQRQKIKLAATISRETDLYLLDEPLSGIDIIARADILQGLLGHWRDSSSVILSTHEIKDVEPVIDRAVFLRDGRFCGDHRVETLRDQGQSVAEAFIETMGGQSHA